MSVIEYIDETSIDKSTWGPGPWQDEPDKREWVQGDFICQALRHKRYGNFCGYVGVDERHRLHGEGYDFEIPIDEKFESRKFDGDRTNIIDLLCASLAREGHVRLSLYCDVHWGLTFANTFPDGEWPGHWFFGFDCGHCDDLQPGMKTRFDGHGKYRALGYVQHEIGRLAEQLEALR